MDYTKMRRADRAMRREAALGRNMPKVSVLVVSPWPV